MVLLLLAAFAAAPLSPPATPLAGAEDTTAAQSAFSAGDYARAVALLEAAGSPVGRGPAASYWLARSEYELGRYDAAVESARRAVTLDPDRSEYHLWLGRALGRMAERAGWLSGFSLARQTRTEFESAVRLDPRNVAAQRDLIEFYARAPGIVGGGTDRAWRQAAALADVEAVEGHLARGHLWAMKDDRARAEAEYRQVLETRPRTARPYLEVADFYEQCGDGARMDEAVEGAAAVASSEPQLAYSRGVAAFLRGGSDVEAERWLRRYLEVPPRSDLPTPAAAHEWLGRLYERQGRLDEAAGEYREALRLGRDRQGARDALRRLERR